MKLRHLDLFSGIGGFALGLSWAGGFQTVAFAEIDPYCRRGLENNFPGVPVYPDIREIDREAVGPVERLSNQYDCWALSLPGTGAVNNAYRKWMASRIAPDQLFLEIQ